jgi:hypothetical protein
MTRSRFTCSRCSAVLARVQPATVLRIETGVAVTHNRRFGSLALRCACGQVMRETIHRKVEVIVIGAVNEVAA